MADSSANFKKFRKLLEELFQLDQADLDFGIYRILNQKRDEVIRFLDEDLLPQVKQAFAEYESADSASLTNELEQQIKNVEAAGMNSDDAPKVQELRKKIAESSVDIEALESEVFSHLYNFFRRYYNEGDFISQRRYKEGVYAIPYEGEEVKLHWANHDQYYVKSSEYFKDYIFTTSAGKTVRVHLAAATTEQDNRKEQAGKERRFILCDENPIFEEDGELFIRFEYKTGSKKNQDALNQEAVERIKDVNGFDGWKKELFKPAPTEKNRERTLFEKHLRQYTARNTFDYFIHKDLGGFLRRELDFYIKNEVIQLDDIENEYYPRVEQYLSKVKAIRRVCTKIIQFLAQLENFQKKLWQKRKFVIETNYCVPVSCVPNDLLTEIAENEKQYQEWEDFFKLSSQGVKSAAELTPSFFENHQNLPLDTRHFSNTFRDNLLASIENLNDATVGTIFNCDSFHCLSLLQGEYKNKIKMIYIDPPYNTGGDDFIYKDNYQHSSWLTMLGCRIRLAGALLSNDGSSWISIDDNEQPRLNSLLSETLGEQNEIAKVVWQKVFSPKNSAQYFSCDHEYLIVWAKNKAEWRPELLPRSKEADDRYKNTDQDERGPWTSSDLTARNYYSEGEYEVTSPAGKKFVPTKGRYWTINRNSFQELDEDNRIWWGTNGENMPRLKRFLSEVKQGIVPQTLWLNKDVGHTQEAKRELLGIVQFKTTADVFNTVKPTKLIRRAIQIGTRKDARDIVLDFFAGSGTTGHAVLQQNFEDGGNRKFILCEMGDYCFDLTRQRVVKAMYSPHWRNGVPLNPEAPSGILKYLRLETYEDSLSNLESTRSEEQISLLEKDSEMREEYNLKYCLDFETRQSILSIDHFTNPENASLKCERAGETLNSQIDLVETFNLLLGLTTLTIDKIKDVTVVIGVLPCKSRALILWRNLLNTDSEALTNWFTKQGYNTQDQEFDVVFVNGDNNLENLRQGDQTWKVRLIEEEFKRLMFDSEGF